MYIYSYICIYNPLPPTMGCYLERGLLWGLNQGPSVCEASMITTTI